LKEQVRLSLKVRDWFGEPSDFGDRTRCVLWLESVSTLGKGEVMRKEEPEVDRERWAS
jgi:hypothetical protein